MRHCPNRITAHLQCLALVSLLLSSGCGGGRSVWSALPGKPDLESDWTRVTYQPPFAVRELGISGSRMHLVKSRHEIVTTQEAKDSQSLVVQNHIFSQESLGRAAAASPGTLFVSNVGSDAILGFSPEGVILFRLLVPPAGGHPARITAIAWHTDSNRLWAVDTANHRVLIWDSEVGKSPVVTIGKRGAGPLQFNYPSDLAIEPSGTVLILDTLNRRVQRLNDKGEFLDILFVGQTTLSRPVALTVDRGGTVWIYDDFTGQVHGFTSEGTALTDKRGAPVQLHALNCKTLFADSSNRLWISSPLEGTITTLTRRHPLEDDSIAPGIVKP